MDQQRFDAMTRALGMAAGRRQVVTGMIGALAGGGIAEALAKGKSRKKPRAEGPCGDGGRKANACTKNSDCCTGICNTAPARKNKDGTGRCRCVKKGSACTASRNCCKGMTCKAGVCERGGTSGCTSNSDCPAPTPVCSNRVCVQCAANGDCPSQAPVCNGNVCVQCAANGDCPTQTPVCSGNVCVQCAADGDCTGPTPYCAGNVCIECLANSDCGGPTDTCTSGTCTCGGSPACGGATPNCCVSTCSAGTWGNQTTFGGLGSEASKFNTPRSVTLSVDGLTAVIADQANNRVSVWTRPNTTTNATAWTNQTTFGGGSGAGPDQFGQIWDVALSVDSLTALVIDGTNGRVSMWTRPNLGADVANWSHQVNFGSSGTGDDQFSGPSSVALTTDGLTAVIADTSNKRMSVWTRTTATSTDWSHQVNFGSGPGSGPGQFGSPYRVGLSTDGLTAAITDLTNFRVCMWTRSSATATDWQPQVPFGSGPGSAANQFVGPTSVKLSTDGLTAIIPEVGNDRVSVWTRTTPTGTDWAPLTPTSFFGSGPGSSASQFSNPYMATFSTNGLTVVVADTDNDRMSVWTNVCPP